METHDAGPKSQDLQTTPAPESTTPKNLHSRRLSQWTARHPVLAIAVVALLTLVVNCYPIIFCGKSFVSPSPRIKLLYDAPFTLPGMTSTAGYDHGSDTAAPLLWSVPVGFVQSRAVMEYGELPLWNRYSHAGDTLIGQGVSMFGDPLQLIVIFGRGSALAWDVKFLLAKFLFCVGFGLLLRRLVGGQWLPLLFTAMAAYSGAFFYINNHPVFFVFSYTPWILLSALELVDLKAKHYFGWGLVWLVANIGCFNGGHLEPAAILMCGLNLAALICGVASTRSLADSMRVIGRMLIGTTLFLGLTAPVWMSFLAALKSAYSGHMSAAVFQIPFATLIGIFDDSFGRLWNTMYAAPGPGTSLLVAVGSIFAMLRWRQFKGEPFFWINTVAIFLWASCVYGVIPAFVLERVPLLGSVHHIYTEFSYLVVLHLTIQCAYGFKCLAQEKDPMRVAADFLWIAIILGAMTVNFCYGIGHRPVPWIYLACAAAAAFASPLLFVYWNQQGERIPAFGWLAVLVFGFIPHVRFGLYTFGQENQFFLPGPRVTLNARGTALDRLTTGPSDPFRMTGMDLNLFGDYAAVYGIEDIHSCAPLSNFELTALLGGFPGMRLENTWEAEIRTPVLAQPLLNMLNVKYLLFSPGATNLPAGNTFRIGDRSDFVVVENLEVWPRAFFSARVIPLPSYEAFARYLLAHPKVPFAALTPEEIAGEPGLPQLVNGTNETIAPATHYQLLPNSTAFDIHATSPGIVCLAEGQSRDFIATANGAPKDVLTVNRAFKGIYLDAAGDYHIEFTFRPANWQTACILFWLTLAYVIAFSALYLISSNRKTRRTQNSPPD